MKKSLFLFSFVLLFLFFTSNSHSLENFHYKAIAFDGVGQLLPSQTVNVRITIQNTTHTYIETHSGVSTDQFACFELTVGSGTVVSGVLADITVTSDTRIMAESDAGFGYVLSTVMGMASEMRTSEYAVLDSKVDVIDANNWEFNGNSGTIAGTNFVGTTDNVPLEMRVEDAGTINNSLILNTNSSLFHDSRVTGVIEGDARGSHAVDLQSHRTTASNVASNSYSTIGGGANNKADGEGAVVSGGESNTASGDWSAVGGGGANQAIGNQSTVSGGWFNEANGVVSTVGGGVDNTADANYSTVGGGQGNTASAIYSIISGGRENTALSTYSTIGGGYDNTASGGGSTISGGNTNAAGGEYGTIGGGLTNTASANYSAVSGGYSNTASGTYSFVGGGLSNTASGTLSTVGGGNGNQATNSRSTVAGGHSNASTGEYAAITGGWLNYATGDFSTVAGGSQNTASGEYASVLGGNRNTAQSYGETVLGLYATVGSGSATSFVGTDRLFVVGNGTGTAARSNALVMLKNGNTTLNGEMTINDVLRLTPRASAPSSPTNGTIYYNSTDDTLYLYAGGAWVALN